MLKGVNSLQLLQPVSPMQEACEAKHCRVSSQPSEPEAPAKPDLAESLGRTQHGECFEMTLVLYAVRDPGSRRGPTTPNENEPQLHTEPSTLGKQQLIVLLRMHVLTKDTLLGLERWNSE